MRRQGIPVCMFLSLLPLNFSPSYNVIKFGVEANLRKKQNLLLCTNGKIIEEFLAI